MGAHSASLGKNGGKLFDAWLAGNREVLDSGILAQGPCVEAFEEAAVIEDACQSQAAIGLAQLGKLEGFNRARQENARYLSESLKSVIVPAVPAGTVHVFHQYTVHKQAFYTGGLGYAQTIPQAERAACEVLSLPVHRALTPEEKATIVKSVNEWAERNA